MKNIYLRLAVIGGVVALGATAIGQSMMASRDSSDPAPIEISQIPPGESPQQPQPPSFPSSHVVLASNDTPTEAAAHESTSPTSPEPPAPTPASRFRIGDGSEAATPVESESPHAAEPTPASSAGRYSRFLGDSSQSPTAAAETATPPSPPVGSSRFSVGDSHSTSTTNPAAHSAENPAASSMPSMPPGPRSFASEAENATAAGADAAASLSNRFQTGVSTIAEQATQAATEVETEAGAAAAEASSTAQEGLREANSRFSTMVHSAAESIPHPAEPAGSAAPTPAPGTMPMHPGFSASPNPSTEGSTVTPMPPNPARFSAGLGSTSPAQPHTMSADPAHSSVGGTPPMQPTAPNYSITPHPSVTGSASPTGMDRTRGFSETPATPVSAQLGSQPLPAYPPASSPQPTHLPEPTAIASRTPATQGMLVSARPGDIRLEGDQQPSIRLEKIAPPEVQVGKVATFELHLENNGQVDASNVIVRDMVPAGTKLVSTSPQAQVGSDGSLIWDLGTLQPQERQSLKLEILPLEEGNIGSVASVSFAATASAKSIVTRPKLTLTQASAATVLAGNQLGITITINNPGTGAATGIVLEENVPGNFAHPAGKELEFEVGTLKPGESRTLDLVLNAVAAGHVQNILRARGDGNLSAEHALDLEVVAPQLQVAMNGPELRYLERPAKYTVSISNPGTAPAHEIDLVTYLPKGLKFVEANHAGQYDSTRHAVFWSLQELPPAQTGTVELVALPIEAGDQRLRVEGSADKGLTAEDESMLRVEGLAAIFFEVADVADPIEVGKDTTYEIKVVNQGSKEATNVQIAAALPDGLRAISADGEVPGQIQGQQIIFQSIARIEPKQSVRLKIQAQGVMPGDQRIRVQVRTDGIPNPITKEESTTVYSDR